MNYPKALTIQDISCYGQCSITVALPLMSACGVETVIMPSAVLSTHTSGFEGFTCKDLTEYMKDIKAHWMKQNIKFDGIYTGYIASKSQIDFVLNCAQDLLKDKAKFIVDPAMADNGKLYPAFDDSFIIEMRKLVDAADIILPNITEASMLTNMEYKTSYDKDYILNLSKKLCNKPSKIVVITGVGFDDSHTGVSIYQNGELKLYQHDKLARGSHGTGDVFSSVFVGSYLKDLDVYKSAKIAADFTYKCIVTTKLDEGHDYGVEFEKEIPNLIKMLNN